jgi:hypothetical protein
VGILLLEQNNFSLLLGIDRIYSQVSQINSAEREGSPMGHVPSVDKSYHKKQYMNIY